MKMGGRTILSRTAQDGWIHDTVVSENHLVEQHRLRCAFYIKKFSDFDSSSSSVGKIIVY